MIWCALVVRHLVSGSAEAERYQRAADGDRQPAGHTRRCLSDRGGDSQIASINVSLGGTSEHVILDYAEVTATDKIARDGGVAIPEVVTEVRSRRRGASAA